MKNIIEQEIQMWVGSQLLLDPYLVKKLKDCFFDHMNNPFSTGMVAQ